MQVNATSAAVEPRPLVFAGLPATSWAFAIRIWIARPGGTAAADRSCGPAKAGRDQISRRAPSRSGYRRTAFFTTLSSGNIPYKPLEKQHN
jgi:hypothetical protein